eukprot:TRINITY_DN8451_c0_g1_i1.p1 TRINITY_DN8451_c0_g1~~TRINITY_DN8451_c0_g1_i1.p1  ORF type:complete len:510 (-),score=75.13 TRINITY_DN8451_c0_g1_i1:155-1684(-)
MEHYDVVIVGAGLAGLSCALHLQDYSDKKILVLEARNRVGGRSFTEQTSGGCPCDLGGSYIGPGQDRILHLLKRFGLTNSVYKIFHEGESVFINSSGTRSTYKGDIPNLKWHALLEINSLLVELHDWCSQIPLEDPWNAPQAQYLDSITVSEWLNARMWTEDAKNTLISAFRVLYCAEPSECSVLFFLWTCHSGENISRLIAVENGAQERKVAGGIMQLPLAMVKELKEKVRLNCQVKKIHSSNSRITLTIRDGETGLEREISCENVVVAIPPVLYASIDWFPSLPPSVLQLSQRMPMGCVIKTFLYYKRPYWREQGLSGEILNISGYPVVYSVDDTQPDGSFPALMGFIVANSTRILQEKTSQERRTILEEFYSRVLNIPEKSIGYEEKNWSADPLSGGCYNGVCLPNTFTTVYKSVREGNGSRIFFAGTEMAIQWMGYMDGAIESGQMVAAKILKRDFVKPPPSDIIPWVPVGPGKLERSLPTLNTVIYCYGIIFILAIALTVVRFV